jgi:uroporphyrinogen-III synthase
MPLPLHGRRVALAEGRQLEELADLLSREGATPLRYPLLSILDAPDPAPVVAWLRDLIAGRFAVLVLMTGEGVRRLLGFADREGIRDAAIAALGRTKTITRGPKPVKALQEIGVTPSRIADAPTTDGVIAALRSESLKGEHVGVQMYSPTNPPLTDFLAQAGAVAHPVLPYVYAPAADADRIADLIDRLAGGSVDAVVFTSSPQVTRLYEVAAERGQDSALAAGLKRTCVAAVGPVVAETLREHGAPVHVCPEQGFVMKNLVRQLTRHLTGGATKP